MAALYRTLTGQSTRSNDSTDPNSLSRTSTSDPLTGILHHLTEHQQDLLDEFKLRLQKDGWWKPDSVNGKPSHDDGTLLRFLRARKFDVGGAIGQFTDTESWLKEQRVEELYEHFDVDLYERARTMYPQWTGHRDRRGIPVYVFVIKHLDSKNVSKYQKQSQEYKATLPYHKNLSTPAKLLPLFALYQNLLNFVMPLCSTLERPHPEVPVTNSTNIVDISGVGLTQFWNLKAHMQDASVLATAHYPETLDRIFIIGAPAFFPTVWSWIKRWFDPVTVSKIFVLRKDEVKPTLLKFMDASAFPKKYGGELDWEFGDLPNPEPEILQALEKDGNQGWIRGPALWLKNRRVAVGSENGKLRRSDEEIAALMPIVYAADGTDHPVHPGKSSNAQEDYLPPYSSPIPDANGTIEKPVQTTSVTAEAAATASTNEQSDQGSITPTQESPGEDIRKSPVDESRVHVQENQATPSTKTAEQLSHTSTDHSENHPLPQPAPEPLEKHPSTSTSSRLSGPPSPTLKQRPSQPTAAIPSPGPASTYEREMTAAIASKLEDESVSTIPAVPPNSVLPSHPQLTVATDAAKGIAIRTDRLNAVNSTSEKEHLGHEANGSILTKPPIERFVTAAEF